VFLAAVKLVIYLNGIGFGQSQSAFFAADSLFKLTDLFCLGWFVLAQALYQKKSKANYDYGNEQAKYH